jgi:DNA-cytosine methyltransferase
MRVLSLFDGISCARVSLDRAGLDVETYYSSEIDKHAISISEKNYPESVRLGSVIGLTPPENIDLLIGGSPCQDLSIAKKGRKGLEGDRSGLFWEYVRIKNECNPKYFILENVASMPSKDRDLITKTLGVEPVMFNASLVSAQCRKRLFWTNIEFELPEDRGILLKDILQPDAEVDERMVLKGKAFTLTATYSKVSPSDAQINNSIQRRQRTLVKMGYIGNSNSQGSRVYGVEGKSSTLSTSGSPLIKQDHVRKLTPIECERLQSLPDNYTEGIAKTNRYKCLGNAFNVEVVAHILSHLTHQVHQPLSSQ